LTPALILIAALISAFYAIVWLSKPQSLIRSLLKTGPMGLLVLAAISGSAPIIIILALIACSAGDYFLSREGEKQFLFGLTAFLIGHLFYIAYFARSFSPNLLGNAQVQQTGFLLLALVAMVLLRIWPHLKELRIPIIIYGLTIAAMAFFARIADPGLTILAGIVLFMVSDILLANDKFMPLSKSILRQALPYFIWVLYFTSQLLIVLGFTGNAFF